MTGNGVLAPVREVRTLTGLRGVAALWVVSLHYTIGAGWSGAGFWYAVAAVGNQGVIIFFLLSGYILSYVYETSTARHPLATYAPFMWARIARIYPLHLVTLVAWGGLIALGLVPRLPGDTPVTFVQNLLLVQAWGFTGDTSWNALSWTVSIELFCYLLFPFVAFALARRSVLFCAAVLGISLACVGFVPYDRLLRLVGLSRDLPLSYGFYVSHFGFLFLAGMALQRVTAWLHATVPHQRLFDLHLLVGLWIVMVHAHPPVFDWTIAVGSSLVIIGISTDSGLGQLLFGNRLMVFLGEISYALYLTHGMFRLVFHHYAPAVSLPVTALLALLFAVVVHYLVERPARAALRRLLPRLDGFKIPAPSSGVLGS